MPFDPSQLALQALKLLNSSSSGSGCLKAMLRSLREAASLDTVSLRLAPDTQSLCSLHQGEAPPCQAAVHSPCLADSQADSYQSLPLSVIHSCLCGHVLQEARKPFAEQALQSCLWSNDLSGRGRCVIPDSLSLEDVPCYHQGIRSLMILPLQAESRCIGLLLLADHRTDRLSLDLIQGREELAESFTMAARWMLSELSGKQARPLGPANDPLSTELSPEPRTLQTRAEELCWAYAEQRPPAREHERLLLALYASGQGVWDWDLSSNEVYFSPRWKAMLGYSDSEVPNRIEEWSTRIHPDDYQRVMDTNRQFYHSRNSWFEIEYRLQGKDGSYRLILSRACCLRDGSGYPVRLVGTHTDITPRKESQERLRKHNEFTDVLAQTMKDILNSVNIEQILAAVVDRAGAISNTQDGFIYFYEESEDCLILRVGRGRFREFIGYRLQPGRGLAGRVWQTGRTKVVEGYSEWHGRLPDAVFDELQTAAALPLLTEGKVIGILGVNHFSAQKTFAPEELAALNSLAELASIALEKTKLYETLVQELQHRKKMEKALQASREEYKLIAENTTDVIWTAELSESAPFCFTYVSPSITRLLGYSPQEYMAMDYREFLTPASYDLVNSLIESRIRNESSGQPDHTPKRFELEQISKSGQTIWTEIITTALRDAQGRYIGVHGVTREITERKELEMMRENVKRVVHHELKAPLNSILSLTTVLSSYDLDEHVQAFIQRIDRAGSKMLHMVNLSLDFSKMEEGSYRLRPEPFDLLEMVHELDRQWYALREKKDLKLHILVQGEKPSSSSAHPIEAERNIFELMLSNLLLNALEASPEGRPVRLDLRKDQGGHYIAIHNWGQIPKQVQDKFFEPYITHGKHRGTGLGTYFAHLIAKAHGGNITFSTSSLKGVTVTVFIPG